MKHVTRVIKWVFSRVFGLIIDSVHICYLQIVTSVKFPEDEKWRRVKTLLFRAVFTLGAITWVFIFGAMAVYGTYGMIGITLKEVEAEFSKTVVVENETVIVKKEVVIVYPEFDGEFSAYNAEEAQTDADPFTMASGKRVYDGAIANNCLDFGTKIVVDGKQYTVDDRMNSRYGCKHFDIFMWDKQLARDYGRQQNKYSIR